MKTEIVYVCSPNFWRYLYLSLRTLLVSGTQFETVRVYVVTNDELNWPEIHDDRVVIQKVEDIGARGPWGYYWGNNKIHLCNSDADRVIYLDTDVMILKPLELTCQGKNADLVARYAVATYMKKHYDPEKWKKVLEKAGSMEYPFYSPGFMVFQNGSHKKIAPIWHKVIEKILRNELPLPANKHAEMYAFSIAAGIVELSHDPMEEWHHRYAMIGEPHHDAVVWHLGTPGFYRHYLPVERDLGLHKKDLPVPRPSWTRAHAQYVRVRHRLMTKIYGRREARLEY